MSLASRTPTLVLLAVVLAAAVLLIAGYGLPVGIGLVVGLLLGLTLFLAFLAMNPRSRSHQFGTWSAPLVAADPSVNISIAQMGRDVMRVAGVDAGVLRKVLAVGDAVEARGVRIELVAIEIREDGGVATLVAHTRPPVGAVGHFVQVAVSDDASTEYVASGEGMGGSGAGASRHAIRFAPAPSEIIRTLTITIDAFVDPFPGPTTELRGPWEFIVSL